jgi:hypothetical protein
LIALPERLLGRDRPIDRRLELDGRRVRFTSVDLGGITDGGDEDRRAGITEFKRHLSDHDAELGSKMVSLLQPGQWLAFDMLNGLRLRAIDRAQSFMYFREWR